MLRTIFAHYEAASWLQRRNPAVKLALVLVYMVVATLLFDGWTLLALTAFALLGTWGLGRAPLSRLLRAMLPFLLLGLGYLWMNALFPRTQGETVEILVRIGPLQIARQGVMTGLVLTARALCFGASSLFFVMTTDPTDFIRSLNQQLRLSPRIAYGALAAYRFLPLLEGELDQIRAAHRLRGVGARRGAGAKWVQLYRYTIPLLASAIRRAGRVAMAMESRAFTGDRERTHYRSLRVDSGDWLLAAGILCVLLLTLWSSWKVGVLRLWQGGLGF